MRVRASVRAAAASVLKALLARAGEAAAAAAVAAAAAWLGGSLAITRARRRVTLPSELMRRLDTYARLRFCPEVVADPEEAARANCPLCDTPIRKAYITTLTVRDAEGIIVLYRACAACAVRQGRTGGHGSLQYSLLQHLACS
jgi:hypothetical protein